MTRQNPLTVAQRAFVEGNFDAALRIARQILETEPDALQVLALAANAAMQLDDPASAIAALKRLQRHRPTDAAIARSLSRALNRLGHRQAEDENTLDAIVCWREALRHWPDNPEATFNLVTRAGSLLDDDESVQLLEALIARDANDAASVKLLVLIERDRGNRERAVDLLRARGGPELQSSGWRALVLTTGDTALIADAIANQPDPAHLVNAAHPALTTLTALHDIAGVASLAYTLDQRDAFGRNAPTLRLALAAQLSLPTVHRDRTSIDSARTRFERGLSYLEQRYDASALRSCAGRLEQLNGSNFLLAYHCQNDLILQSRYGDWLANAAAALRPDLATRSARRKPGPPRIGLLSGHWHLCTAGSYFASWIDALDSTEFDTRVYALGPRFDPFTDALAARTRQFVKLEGTIDSAAEIIAAADLDLLIYPELGMDTRLLPIAALPLARRQWQGWGHPVTSGLPHIDAFLSCTDMEPDNAASHYRERLLLLPDLGTRYVLPELPQRLGRARLGLPDGQIVVIPQSLFKLHPDNDAVIHALLQARPQTHVLLFASESRFDTRLLHERLQARLGPMLSKQLIFHPIVSRQRFLELLAASDLMLDTLGWSGGNTSLDALRAGIPIATTRSAFMRGRQSAAMLQALGMGAAIAADADDLAPLAARILVGDQASAVAPDALEAYAFSDRPLHALAALARDALAGVV